MRLTLPVNSDMAKLGYGQFDQHNHDLIETKKRPTTGSRFKGSLLNPRRADCNADARKLIGKRLSLL
jgi:hypothetical protein